MIPGLIIGGVVLILIIWFISINNRLVALKNNRESAFADIDVQLKQRYDLIPQLLGAVKGYMNHESETLIRVTEARSRCMQAGTISEKIAAEANLGAAMSGFNIQLEAYPKLKANAKSVQHSVGEMTKSAEEAIGGQRIVKIFGAQDFEYQRFAEIVTHNRRIELRLTRISVLLS